jgi:hypothetical protein
VLIVLGSCVLADNILSVIGLLVMVQCWAMCRVMFKEFNVYIGVQQRLHRGSATFTSEFHNVYIGVPTQWKMIFGTGSASRISTL